MDLNDPLALLKSLSTIKSSIGVLKSLKVFWQQHAVGGEFDQALSSTLIEVDKHYSGEIFGGDLRQVFNKTEVKSQLQQVLFAYGEIDKEELAKNIYFENLPDDFFEVFMSIYFNELIKHEETRKSLADWANSQDIISIKEGVSRVEEELKEMKTLLIGLLSKQLKLEELKPVSYPKVPKYLERTLVPFLEFTSSNLEHEIVSRQLWKSDTLNLEGLIQEKNRIVILGVGGFGKSLEFRHLAYVLSIQDTTFPIHIDLADYSDESIEDLLSQECGQWTLIPEERVVLIFDALDEVHTSQTDFFIRRLNKFSKSYNRVKIVVSCRNNQYPLDPDGKGPLDGYEAYSLAPLGNGVILNYLVDELGNEGEEFYQNLWDRNLLDLIGSPFYLIKVTELYIENGLLPEKRSDLFDHLTTKKIENDLEKFKLIGIDLRNFTYKIKKEIYKIAFSCQCLGRGSLDEFEELQEIVHDNEMLQRIQRSFLFNRGDKNKWEFEHNNFREYFTAIFLKEKGFEFIKQIVAFQPTYTKIKPNWVNTLTFLISILDQNSDLNHKVIHFLVEHEPELLFRMEKEKLDLSIRLKLAQEIAMKYESRDLWIRSQKFSTHDISLFISGSPDAFEWLEDRLGSKDSKILLHTLEFLEGFELNSEQKQSLINKLISILSIYGLDEHFYYKTVKLLLKLEVKSEAIVKLLHSNPQYEKRQYIRAGLYLYIKSNKLSDKYLSLLIDGTSQVRKLGVLRNSRRRKRDIYTNLESQHLIEALNAIIDPDSFIRLMEWVTNLPKRSDISIHQSLVEVLVEKCSDYNLEDPKIFDVFVKFLVYVDRAYFQESESQLLEVVKEKDLSNQTFRKLFEQSSSHRDHGYWVMPKLAGIKEVQIVYNEYISGKISDDFVRGFRNLLGGENEEAREWFHTKINEHSGNKFLYDPPVPDWDEIMSKKREDTIGYLHNRESLITSARQIFDIYGQDILLKDHLKRRLGRDLLDSDLNESFALDILRGISTEEGVTFDQFVKHVNDSANWEWIQMIEFLSLERDHGIELQPRDIQILRSWTEKRLITCDFKKALTQSGDQISIKPTEIYVTYLIRHHEFEFPSHAILNLLYMASNHLLLEKKDEDEDQDIDKSEEFLNWIIEKCGFEETKTKVLEILSEDIAQDVFTNLILFTAKHEIYDSLPLIHTAIQSNSFKDYLKRDLLDSYLKLNGDLVNIAKQIDKFSLYTMLHAIDLLYENEYPEIEKLCLNLFETLEDTDKQLELIQRMISFSFVSGCHQLSRWIERNSELPTKHNFQSSISSNETLLKGSYEFLVSIYETAIEHDFGDWDFDGRRSYLELILKAGTLSEESYNYVRMKLCRWMKEYKDHQFLFFKIQELDTQYFQTVSPTMTLDEVLSLID